MHNIEEGEMKAVRKTLSDAGRSENIITSATGPERRLAESVMRSSPADEIAWVAAPSVLGHHSPPHAPRLLRELGGMSLTVARRVFLLPKRPVMVAVGPFLGAYFTENQRRAIEPVLDSIEDRMGIKRHMLRRRRLSMKDIAWVARRLLPHLQPPRIKALRTLLTGRQALDLTTATVLGALEYRSFRKLLRDHSWAYVIVANTQHWSMRALIACCRRLGISSVYVPHAPAALTLSYEDIPTSVALLRTESEKLYYGQMKGATDRLYVIGNPSLDAGLVAHAGTGQRKERQLLFAVSPWDRVRLAEQIALIESATHEWSVDVAPHPRSDLKELEGLCPKNWTLRSGKSTQRLIAEGYSHVVVAGSGVAIEAKAGGAVVANIATRPEYERYLFHYVDPICAPVRTKQDMLRFLSTAPDGDPSDNSNIPPSIGQPAADEGALTLLTISMPGPDTERPVHDVWSQLWRDAERT